MLRFVFFLFLLPLYLVGQGSEIQGQVISYFSTGKLSNGFTYYIHHDPNSKKHTYLDLVVKVGSLDEQEDERGFSHLIEHALFEQVEFKNKKLINSHCGYWDYSYPNIGAVTAYTFTQYHLEISRAIPQGVEAGILGLSRAVSQFSLHKLDMQTVMDELEEEMQDDASSPIVAWKEWRKSKEFPLHKNPYGNLETIYKAPIEKIHRFYAQNYRPDQMALIIAGNLDIQSTMRLIEKYFSYASIPSQSSFPKQYKESFEEPVSIYLNKELKNAFVSVVKLIPHMSQRDSLKFSIFTRLLSEHLQTSSADGKASFSQPILEISTYPRLFRETVTLGDNPAEGIQQLKDAFQTFRRPITQEEFVHLKSEIKNQLLVLREKGNDRALIDFYRDHFLLNNLSLEKDHPDLRTEILETLQVEEVNSLIFSFQGFSHVSMGSPDDKGITPDFLYELLPTNTNRSGYDR